MNITNCRFLRLFKINAIVLYPFVLYCESHPNEGLMAHEQVHLNQIKKEGVVLFYLKYLYEYWQGRKQGMGHYQAYRNISFEKEAYSIGESHPPMLAKTKGFSGN